MFFFFFFSIVVVFSCFFFFSSRRRHTIFTCDWSSDVCSSDLFGNDFAGFESHEPAEVWLGLAQSVADLAHQLAAPGGGDLLPLLECGLRPLNRPFILLGGRCADSGENFAVNGR